MNIVGIIVILVVVAFLGWQIYGLIRDIRYRRTKRKNTNSVENSSSTESANKDKKEI